MAMNAGSVTVDGAGAHSGTGMALAFYEARKARLVAKGTAWSALASSLQVAALQGLADSANDDAGAIVGHITANATVTTPLTGLPGLQSYVPTSGTPAPTAPPLTPISITGTVS